MTARLTLMPDTIDRLTDADRQALEAAVFRRLVAHLADRPQVQNIDMMNLAGFCRNCLSNWFSEAATAQGTAVTKEDAREMVYGMSYAEWKARHQHEATPAQQAAFAAKAKPDGA
jgi:uncharacterized protein